MSLKFVKTCSACPEQYDVFDSDGNEVGYVRLRHGFFRVASADRDETFFSRSFPLSCKSPDLQPEESEYLEWGYDLDADGIFEGEAQREVYLAIAKRVITEAYPWRVRELEAL